MNHSIPTRFEYSCEITLQPPLLYLCSRARFQDCRCLAEGMTIKCTWRNHKDGPTTACFTKLGDYRTCPGQATRLTLSRVERDGKS